MEVSIKAIGQMEYSMVRETFIGLIGLLIKGLINWGRSMAKVLIPIHQKRFIEEIGIMESKAEKASLLIDQVTS
jgi:hypothetical protein